MTSTQRSRTPRVAKKDVEAAEKAAQRSVVDFPDGPVPDELKKALARRVEVSLAAAQDSGVLRRLGGADAEVRRLEAPWSKRRAATPQSRGRSANQASDDPSGVTSQPGEGDQEGQS